MTTTAKQGWLEDPTGRHEFRWFSQGTPTDLVQDAHVTTHDPISIDDPELFAEMDLAEPADTSPLLRRSGSSDNPFDAGILALSIDHNPGVVAQGWTPAGPFQYTLALLPWLIGFPLCGALGAPDRDFVALAGFSLAVVVAGALYRRIRITWPHRHDRPSLYRGGDARQS